MTVRGKLVMTMAVLLMGFPEVLRAEDVWVKRAELQIRDGKGAAFAPVATARRGDKLAVVQREGKWLKVRFGDKQGFVYEEAISPREVSAGGDLGSALGSAESMGLSAAAAAKGLEPGALNFASTSGLSTAPLQTMMARRSAITGAEWVAFAREGGVGPPNP